MRAYAKAFSVMRKLVVLLLPFISASCGTALRDPDYADKGACYQIHGNRIFKNGGDDIGIYLTGVASKGAKSWTSSPYRPFEVTDSSFWPFYGYAAGFGFIVPAVEEVSVSLNGNATVRYRRLKLSPPGYYLTLNQETDVWVPPSFPSHGFRAPELPQGDYRIQVRYRANGRELLAHWYITYRPPGDHKPPLAPTCSTERLAAPPAPIMGRSEQDETQQPLSAALLT